MLLRKKKKKGEREVRWGEIEERSNGRRGEKREQGEEGRERSPVSPESPSTAQGQ